MSINSLACVQSISTKCNNNTPPPPPAVISTFANFYPSLPYFGYPADSGSIVYNASGKVIAFRQTVTNQVSPNTFKNGLYAIK